MTPPRPARAVVAGLGPGDPALVTPAALDALARVPKAFVSAGAGWAARSLPYPVVAGESPAEIAEHLVAVALEAGGVGLGVPGSPLVLEPVVALLLADPRVEVSVVPGVSFCELAWARLGVDPAGSGARVLPLGELAGHGPPASGPLLVADVGAGVAGPAGGGQGHPRGAAWQPQAGDEWPERAIVLHGLGLPGERVEEVPFHEAVTAVLADDVTSMFVSVPAAAEAIGAAGAELARLAAVIRTLRARCPWDREQTHRSLVRHLLEEAYETIEAIEALSVPPSPEQAAHLEEELGDLLCQVYFHATLAAEYGAFDLASIARGLRGKLVVRHPHVFGDTVADDARWVVANWERGKLQEKGRTSLMDGIPPATPALAATAKLERKASGAGLGIDVTGEARDLGKLLEATLTVLAAQPEPGPAGAGAGAPDLAARDAGPAPVVPSPPADEEVGELLFRIARLAAHAGRDPEAAVRGAIARFRERFAAAEEEAAAAEVALHDLPADDRLRIWQRC